MVTGINTIGTGTGLVPFSTAVAVKRQQRTRAGSPDVYLGSLRLFIASDLWNTIALS